ncbi:MAG TPA: hypothetical protein DCS93_07350 [Microscillaceae bacterium]|nr:hypothetical protein [Microscillaceae bacterium]
MISLPLKNWWGQMHYALFETQEESKQLPTPQTKHYESITTQTKDFNHLKIHQDDLKLISIALIRYQKQLANNNQKEKAARVALLDEMFYELIQKTNTKIS